MPNLFGIQRKTSDEDNTQRWQCERVDRPPVLGSDKRGSVTYQLDGHVQVI